jgi:FKBP-type peptidyl-prolyl cis-trans isomerase 2
VTAGQTVYFTYEIEVKAKNEEQAEKIALNKPTSEWDDEKSWNGDALTVDEIEEI